MTWGWSDEVMMKMRRASVVAETNICGERKRGNGLERVIGETPLIYGRTLDLHRSVIYAIFSESNNNSRNDKNSTAHKHSARSIRAAFVCFGFPRHGAVRCRHKLWYGCKLIFYWALQLGLSEAKTVFLRKMKAQKPDEPSLSQNTKDIMPTI